VASWQVQRLAANLAEDRDFRTSFRADPDAAVRVGGFELSNEELEALRAVNWSAMSDEELLVRLRGAAHRGTHQTA